MARIGATYPAKFAPVPIESAWWQRLAWLFSKFGRLRRCLWKAQRHNNATAITSLERALAGTRETSATSDENAAGLLRDAAAYLAHIHLRNGDGVAAARWLQELQALSPARETCVSLRWQLLELLDDKEPGEPLYLTQARYWVGDPAATFAAHGAAIVRVLETVYDRYERNELSDFLSQAHAGLQGHDVFKACRVLAECPDVFASRDEALQWLQKVKAARFDFSTMMKADALVVGARASEWAQSFEPMVRFAEKALELTPHRPRARYWMARALLHVGDTAAAERAAALKLHDEAGAERLQNMIDIMLQESLTATVKATKRLSGGEFEDRQEKELVLKVIRQKLRINPQWTRDQVELAGTLCGEIEVADGEKTWTQIGIAYRFIRVEMDFRGGLAKLSDKVRDAEPDANRLERVARYLIGNPQERETWDEDDPLSLLEAAATLVFKSQAPTLAEEKEERLLNGLTDARGATSFAEFPQLDFAADLFAFALRVCGRGPGQELPPALTDLPIGTPPWMLWLLVRVLMINQPLTDLWPLLKDVDGQHWPVAWLIGSRQRHLGFRSEIERDIAQRTVELVSAALSERQEETAPQLTALWEAYDASFRTAEPWSGSGRESELFAGLGDMATHAIAKDFENEEAVGRARFTLAQGRPVEAGIQFAALRQTTALWPAITRAWWDDALCYWHGVCLARQNDPAAGPLLESLLNGPKADSARGQLAMIALRHGEVEIAASYLPSTFSADPGCVYAQALTATRQGRADEAANVLGETRNQECLRGSVFEAAAERLGAALAERREDWPDAEKRHRAVHEKSPDDPVTKARLARLLLVAAGTPTEAAAREAAQLLDGVGASVSWAEGYALLAGALGAGEVDPASPANLDDKTGEVWRQLLARRLVEQGRVAEAIDLLRVEHGGTRSSLFARAGWVLSSHDVLRRIGESFGLPADDHADDAVGRTVAQLLDTEAVAASRSLMDDYDRSPEFHADPVLQRWYTLHRFVAEAAGQPAVSPPPAPAGDELWPFWATAAMWLGEGEARRAAARQVTAALDNGSGGWNDGRQDLLQTAAHHALNNDAEFLEAFGEPAQWFIDGLPVDPRALWLAAAHGWFRKKDWRRLTGERLPQHLEDRMTPAMRLLVGFACAQAAAGEKDQERAMAKIHRAQELLLPLIGAEDQHVVD
ncbi:MAG: hypothetical protein P9L99_11200 [Candidatus Lernaella stagnicola]|nr:hypothetical protein [Candidatus Lernaella stagnicola]